MPIGNAPVTPRRLFASAGVLFALPGIDDESKIFPFLLVLFPFACHSSGGTSSRFPACFVTAHTLPPRICPAFAKTKRGWCLSNFSQIYYRLPEKATANYCHDGNFCI
jgi:hypothetical protein